MKQLALGVRLRAEAVFDSFAPGENSEVLTALRSANATPLWLWGAHGSGKTHLLQAVCAAAGDTAAYFPLDRSLGLPSEALAGFERSHRRLRTETRFSNAVFIGQSMLTHVHISSGRNTGFDRRGKAQRSGNTFERLQQAF